MKKYALVLAALLTMTSVNAGNKGFLGPRSEGSDGGSPAARARSAFNGEQPAARPPAIRIPGREDEGAQAMATPTIMYAGPPAGGADEEEVRCGCCSRRTANWLWNALARAFMGKLAEE